VLLALTFSPWLPLTNALPSATRLIARLPPPRLHRLHAAAPTLTDHAPSWENIKQELMETDSGKRLYDLQQEQRDGHGPPSAHARLRLFEETDESNVRVTLYRDSAAWCPYCQKVHDAMILVLYVQVSHSHIL